MRLILINLCILLLYYVEIKVMVGNLIFAVDTKNCCKLQNKDTSRGERQFHLLGSIEHKYIFIRFTQDLL